MVDVAGRIREIEEELARLPNGYISKKLISGKERFYLQWLEKGKLKSKYIKAAEFGEISAQIKSKFALPNTPTHYCYVNVPSTTQMYSGIANEVSGWGAGGGVQFELAQSIPESAFGNGIALP